MEGGEGAKKRKRPQKRCRHDVKNEGDSGGSRNKCRQKYPGSIGADRGNLEIKKATERKAYDAQGVSKNCRERACALC